VKQKSFWVITSFYNPAGYQRRIRNYHVFRRNLGVSLLTIELAEPGQYQLTPDDADQLVQVRGNNRIWQKERLLNIAISALPEEAEFVAWVDCDVLFDNPDWATEAESMMRAGKSFVQLFETATHLPPQLSPEQVSPVSCRDAKPLFSEQSFASSVLSGNCFLADNRPDRTEMENGLFTPGALPQAHGIGWAGHRDMLREVGLYDACVIGGGDRAMALASIGCAGMLSSVRPMTNPHIHHYLSWAEQLNGSKMDQIGFVSGTVFHLWHGRFERRGYKKRHEILKQLAFDPYDDLHLAENGTWRWAQNATALQSTVGAYFFSRLEDKV
jgi:hypothetical protein